LFHLSGEKVDEGVYRIDDDMFLDRLVRKRPATAEVVWHGRAYEVDVPELPLPLFITLEGLRSPPPGGAILVLRRKARMWELFRRPRASTGVVKVSQRPQPPGSAILR